MRLGKFYLIVCFLTISAVFACSQDEGAATLADMERQQEGQPADMAPQTASVENGQAAAQQVEIAGTVEETAEGLVIRSVNEAYMVTGSDLTQMIGKDVMVKGTLEESDGKPTLHVESVSVIE
jgi:hypothetical protein